MQQEQLKEAATREATANFLGTLGDGDLAAEYRLLLGERRAWRGSFSAHSHNPQGNKRAEYGMSTLADRMADWGYCDWAGLAVLGSPPFAERRGAAHVAVLVAGCELVARDVARLEAKDVTALTLPLVRALAVVVAGRALAAVVVVGGRRHNVG